MTIARYTLLVCLSFIFVMFIACSEGGSTGDGDSTPKITSAPQVENYSGCKGLEDLIPKLAMPGSVTISYYQVVQIGKDNICDDIIKKVNKPENLKD